MRPQHARGDRYDGALSRAARVYVRAGDTGTRSDLAFLVVTESIALSFRVERHTRAQSAGNDASRTDAAFVENVGGGESLFCGAISVRERSRAVFILSP